MTNRAMTAPGLAPPLASLLLAGGLALCTGPGQAQPAAKPLPLCPVADGTVANYDIVRGGTVIGRHTVSFAVHGADLTATIAVEANLYALGIRVYHYEHSGREQWRDGRMVALDTRTLDDGKAKQVSAAFDPTRGTWTGVTSGAPVSGPLMASSFWHSGTVRQTRFLDDESGVVNAVRVTPAGPDTVAVNGRAVPASRFDLVGNSAGTVWYDGQGCWVRALFKSPVDGSMVEVRSRG